jgi:hypothetical protein
MGILIKTYRNSCGAREVGEKEPALNVEVSVLDPMSKLVRTDLAARNQERVERG